jgi:hypothetical protein
MNKIDDQVNASLKSRVKMLVAPGPIPGIGLGLNVLPWNGVTKPMTFEDSSSKFKILTPELVVLRPPVLVNIQVRNDRAFDAGRPAEGRAGKVLETSWVGFCMARM